MKYIFYSNKICHLKINGEYFLTISNNPVVIDNLNDNILMEFIPINPNYLPCQITTLNSNIIFYDNCYYVFPTFIKLRNLKYKILFQNTYLIKNQKVSLTIISDGCYKYYIDGLFFDTGELPFFSENVILKEINNILFFIIEGEKKVIIAYSLINLGEITFKQTVDSYEISSYLKISYKIEENLCVFVNETYSFDKEFTLINRQVENNINNPKLTPYFFMLYLKLNLPLNSFICENLLDKVSLLKEFIGNINIIIFSSENYVLYLSDNEIKKAVFSLKDGLIENVNLN